MSNCENIELRPAGAVELLATWEWEVGAPTAATEVWVKGLLTPGWSHLGIWDGEALVAVVSWEQWPNNRVCAAVSARRRSIAPRTLRRILRALIDEFFLAGVHQVCAVVAPGARAVRRLAFACGLRARKSVRGFELFALSNPRSHYE